MNEKENTNTCVGVPKTLAKSARKAAIALYWTKLTVENLVTERWANRETTDKVRRERVTHFVFFDFINIFFFCFFLFFFFFF